MICRACQRDHSPMLTCGRAARIAECEARNAKLAADAIDADFVRDALSAVSTRTKPVSTDRHKPGYQRDLMRKRRAAAKAAK